MPWRNRHAASLKLYYLEGQLVEQEHLKCNLNRQRCSSQVDANLLQMTFEVAQKFFDPYRRENHVAIVTNLTGRFNQAQAAATATVKFCAKANLKLMIRRFDGTTDNSLTKNFFFF